MTDNTTAQTIEDDPIEVRRNKRQAMIDAGEDPYGHAFAYTHHIADLNEAYAGLEDGEGTEDEVAIAGSRHGEARSGKARLSRAARRHRRHAALLAA